MTESKGHEFLRLHQGGMSYTAIAEARGTTKGVVAGVLFRMKHPYDPRAKREYRRKKQTEIKELRIASREELARLAVPVCARDKKTVALYAQGLPLREIGQHIGVSGQQIRDDVRRICGAENYERLHTRGISSRHREKNQGLSSDRARNVQPEMVGCPSASLPRRESPMTINEGTGG